MHGHMKVIFYQNLPECFHNDKKIQSVYSSEWNRRLSMLNGFDRFVTDGLDVREGDVCPSHEFKSCDVCLESSP